MATPRKTTAAKKAAPVEDAPVADPADVEKLQFHADGRITGAAGYNVVGIDPPADGCFVLAEQDAAAGQSLIRQQTQDAPAEVDDGEGGDD